LCGILVNRGQVIAHESTLEHEFKDSIEES